MSVCPKCGLNLDGAAVVCPGCGWPIGLRPNPNRWLIAAVQIALSTAFMLIFKFPKVMIVIFAVMILGATALSGYMKPNQLRAQAPQPPIARPTLFRISNLGVAVCGFAFLVSLLFGFVVFINSYTRWQQYDGATFRQADFLVTHGYYQKRKGGADIYASGTVEGNREWMSLGTYVQPRPRNQADLDVLLPAGTSIPVYLFPQLKGRARVQLYSNGPPAERYHREAMDALKYGLGGLAMSAAMLLILLRVRAACFGQKESAFAATA